MIFNNQFILKKRGRFFLVYYISQKITNFYYLKRIKKYFNYII
jgi:hypothetical protein